MAVRRHRVRTLLAGVLTALTLSNVLSVVSAAPAAAAGTSGYCPDATGVTVVVDFNELGGGVVIRCAPGEQASGLTALQNAGFTVAGTNRYGLALLCRIDGKPTAATEPCVDVPPMTAYWSYWHAPDGGAWTSSEKAVNDSIPPQGSFEGWSFSKDHPDGAASQPGAAPTRPAPSASTTAPPVDVSATRAASGVPVGTLAGVAVLVALAAAAGVIAWRRRSTRDA